MRSITTLGIILLIVVALTATLCGRKIAQKEAYNSNQQYSQKMSDLKDILSISLNENGFSSLLISEFSNFEGAKERLGAYFAEELSFHASSTGMDINIVDRSQLQRLVKEQELLSAGLLDKNTLVSLGKMIGIQSIVTGKYQVLDDKVQVWLRMIDVEKGIVVLSERMDIEIEKDLQEIISEQNSWWK
ncbi:FlgO family outer membrane protein [Lewinella sp. LCG006]|uniref:FlgO family outer membrane protein n=1 Tax=Lewinella sp. LCG006 TaxID=3231911 RepID=UPI00346038A6